MRSHHGIYSHSLKNKNGFQTARPNKMKNRNKKYTKKYAKKYAKKRTKKYHRKSWKGAGLTISNISIAILLPKHHVQLKPRVMIKINSNISKLFGTSNILRTKYRHPHHLPKYGTRLNENIKKNAMMKNAG